MGSEQILVQVDQREFRVPKTPCRYCCNGPRAKGRWCRVNNDTIEFSSRSKTASNFSTDSEDGMALSGGFGLLFVELL